MTKIICDKCGGEKSVAEIHVDNVSYLTTAAVRRGKVIDEEDGRGRRRNTFHGRPQKIELCIDCRVQLAKIIMDFIGKQAGLFGLNGGLLNDEQPPATPTN